MLVKTSVSIDERVYKLLKHYCVEYNQEMSLVITKAVDDFLFENVAREEMIEEGSKWNLKVSKKKGKKKSLKKQ